MNSLHFQALFGAGGGAEAAADAFFRIQLPGFRGSLHLNGFLGAFFGAEGTVYALGSVVHRVNNRFVSAFHHHPAFPGAAQAFFGFIADPFPPPLNHISDICFILQHVGDPFSAPQAG